MQILIKTIYAEEEAAVESDEDIQGLARDACQECIDILKEPEKSQAKPATKVLCAFVSTTRRPSFHVFSIPNLKMSILASVSRYTISQAIPHLFRLFLDPDEASNRAATLFLLSEFTEAARDYNDKNKTSPTVNSLLMPYKDEVLGVFSVGLNASSTRNAALLGLNAMVATQGLLSNEELGFIVHNVDQVLEGEQDDVDDAK